jgi:NADPH-dependent F420 reductase
MIAIVGGTGPLGGGLARRLVAAGETVIVGSRDAARAASAAATVCGAAGGSRCEGAENRAAVARAERVVLALPGAALPEFLDRAGPSLAGKLVIDVVVPLAFEKGFATIVPLPGAPSASELIQRRVPGARVVGAFKNTPADALLDLGAPLEGDVIVCSDDAAARAEVSALVGRLGGLRAVDGGRLANARSVEAITALLVNLNRLHGARTSIAILGLGGRRPSS